MNMPPRTPLFVPRRRFIGLLGGLGAATLIAPSRALWAQDAAALASDGCIEPSILVDGFETPLSSCVLIPSETQGPYPPLSVLSNAAMRRQDTTEGRPGLPLLLKIKLVNINANCAPIPDAAVYLWYCDKEGVYSGYSQPGANTVGQTFCRGIQYSDCNGEVNLTAIYPGWYAGRITHLHFQVYLNNGGTLTATSQIAFPQAVTQAVYATALYPRGQNTSVTSFAQDNVFSDGTTYQMLTLSGDASTGFVGRLAVGVAA